MAVRETLDKPVVPGVRHHRDVGHGADSEGENFSSHSRVSSIRLTRVTESVGLVRGTPLKEVFGLAIKPTIEPKRRGAQPAGPNDASRQRGLWGIKVAPASVR